MDAEFSRAFRTMRRPELHGRSRHIVFAHGPAAHQLTRLLLLALRATLVQPLLPLLQLRDVREGQLEVDDVDVSHRVHLAGNVDDVVILKTPDYLRWPERLTEKFPPTRTTLRGPPEALAERRRVAVLTWTIESHSRMLARNLRSSRLCHGEMQLQQNQISTYLYTNICPVYA
jgi:hypothetical protein